LRRFRNASSLLLTQSGHSPRVKKIRLCCNGNSPPAGRMVRFCLFFGGRH
jgi:hypothetical protein